MADAGVPVVGRGDEDGVEFLDLEKLAVVGEALGAGGLADCLVDHAAA